MDGIEKIIERINAASAEECAAIAQEAEKNCEAIRADYAQKVQSAYDSAVKSGELEIKLDAERLVRNAKLDARKELLGAKQEAMDMAFEAAKQKLASLGEAEYVAWLAGMACEASGGTGELIFSKRDAALAEKVVAKANEALLSQGKQGGLTVSDETRDMDTGFVLRDGRLEVNCTLSAILDMKRKDIAAAVAGMLFG